MALIAVIDVETTGLNPYRHDRVVEVAALVVRSTGDVLREFVTLVNPERDIGPISVHGLLSEDVLRAPRFGDVAGSLCEFLDGCVALAGHNVRFDLSFLGAEFNRLGCAFPSHPALCTLQMTGGGSLPSCCQRFGIRIDGRLHSALHDARASAHLLAKLLASPREESRQIANSPPLRWPPVPRAPASLWTRDESRRYKEQPPTYLQKLLARSENHERQRIADAATLAYMSLLDSVLEDRRVDMVEGESLFEVATKWGLSGMQVMEAHEAYLRRLASVAFEDQVLTESEERDLLLVARMLGVKKPLFEQIIFDARRNAELTASGRRKGSQAPITHEFAGKKVCFTGELQCHIRGTEITKERAAELASQRGLVVVNSVTKDLDLLVVADPNTQSGKAKKARSYGIRVLHEPVFWRSIGVMVE